MTEYQNLINEFQPINPKTIKNNIFEDLELYGYCFNVHDTDTISVLFKFNDQIVKYNLRLDGIDAPELKSKDENERELCIKGTNFLKELILNKIIKIKTIKADKYGRLLSNIYSYGDDQCINDLLITMGFCKQYDGGKKEDWNLTSSDPLAISEEIPALVEEKKPAKLKISKAKLKAAATKAKNCKKLLKEALADETTTNEILDNNLDVNPIADLNCPISEPIISDVEIIDTPITNPVVSDYPLDDSETPDVEVAAETSDVEVTAETPDVEVTAETGVSAAMKISELAAELISCAGESNVDMDKITNLIAEMSKLVSNTSTTDAPSNDVSVNTPSTDVHIHEHQQQHPEFEYVECTCICTCSN